MKQIDQKPHEYRAEPLKGEPVFAPGAGRKVLIAVVVLLIGLAVSVATYPIGQLTRWLSCTFLTGSC